MSTATLEQAEEVIAKMRKNKEGVWVVSGPVSLVVEGQVTVTLKSGATTVKTIVWVGNGFAVDGSEEQHRYGYLEPQGAAAAAAPARVTPTPVAPRMAAAPAPSSAHDFMPADFTPDESLPADLVDDFSWAD
ncbi:MAG TPA: hypothetical protein VF867_16605 [Arthrobacter sp.]